MNFMQIRDEFLIEFKFFGENIWSSILCAQILN
jgi:hypothetical protein